MNSSEKKLNTAEGIDTISIEVKGNHVNKKLWWNRKMIQEGLTLRVINYSKYIVDIQFELLEMDKPILRQIATIIYFLWHKDYIVYEELGNIKESASLLVQYFEQKANILYFLSEVHFFFDFQEKDIVKYIIAGNYKNGNYSSSYKKSKSLWIVYDRRPRLKKVNKINHNVIDTMKYPIRLEIRLTKTNCQYININNLAGSYYVTMLRNYCTFIAKSWRRYNSQLCNIALYTKDHPCFNYILFLSWQKIQLGTSSSLLKSNDFGEE